MMENQQSIKKDRSANSYSKIFPWTFTDLVLDRVTKESLDNILVRNNFIALPYVGSKAATRLQVPMKNKRRGIWLSYIDYAGTLTVEYYNDNNLDDNHWQDSSYWLPYNTAEFQPASVALINCYLTGTSVGLENCSVISPYGNTLKYSTTVDKINTKELVTSSLATNATYTVLPTAPLNSVYLITAVTNGNSAARGLAIVTIPTDYGMASVDNLVANANCQISIDATGNIIVTNTSSSAKAYRVSLLKLI